MVDYKTNDPKGWCGDPTRGAALGRPTIHDASKDFNGKLYLRRVYLNSGGYDINGTYFGFGMPLYWYADKDYNIDAMLRASSRESAKLDILKQYPTAKFFR